MNTQIDQKHLIYPLLARFEILNCWVCLANGFLDLIQNRFLQIQFRYSSFWKIFEKIQTKQLPSSFIKGTKLNKPQNLQWNEQQNLRVMITFKICSGVNSLFLRIKQQLNQQSVSTNLCKTHTDSNLLTWTYVGFDLWISG